jgi:hypothetical protein
MANFKRTAHDHGQGRDGLFIRSCEPDGHVTYLNQSEHRADEEKVSSLPSHFYFGTFSAFVLNKVRPRHFSPPFRLYSFNTSSTASCASTARRIRVHSEGALSFFCKLHPEPIQFSIILVSCGDPLGLVNTTLRQDVMPEALGQ